VVHARDSCRRFCSGPLSVCGPKRAYDTIRRDGWQSVSDNEQGDAARVTRLFFALILIITAFVQITVFPIVNVLGIGPNLILVLVLVWSGLRGTPEGLLWVFPLGLLLDVLTLDPLGSNGLALVPVALIGGLARRRLFHSGVIIPLVAVVAATLAHHIVTLLVSLLAGTSYPLLASVRLGILTALLNVLVVPPMYLFVLLMERMGVGRAARA